MKKSVQEKLEEAYKHIKPYIEDQKELRSMCLNCQNYCGKEHDYAECRNKECFTFWLAYVYLDWLGAFE